MTVERRLTIGVLKGTSMYAGSSLMDYLAPIIHGIQMAAQDQKINLLLGCGVNRGIGPGGQYFSAWPEKLSTSDFVPVGAWNTDGLLIITPIYFEEQRRFIREQQENGFPVVFIGSGSGTPEFNVDNESGMRMALEHLAAHGHRYIAFIAGLEGDGDSESRLKAYREAVEELGLTKDPRLVEFGGHDTYLGVHAMKRVLQSGVKFSAVACSNDLSAVGAISAMKEAGLRIPRDVAVTGFDDNIASLALIPPLTTVHYPLFETGYRALLLLCKRVEKGPGSIPEETRIGTWLVPRQSCGCLPEEIKAVAVHNGSDRDLQTEPRDFKEEISRMMMESVFTETSTANLSNRKPLCDLLVESFFQSVQNGDLSHFQNALIDVLQQIETVEQDAYPWQAAVSVLRTGALKLLANETDARRRQRAEDLVNQARMLFGESTSRHIKRIQVQQAQAEETMGRLTAQLLSSLDEEQVYSILEDDLPKVGVRSGYVALFEPQGDDPVGGSRMRTYQKDAPPLRFATREFPPAGLYPEGEPFSLALLPLFFQEEKLGYVAFDGSNLYPLVTLVRQIASALKSAELHGKVLELSLTDGLTGVHNRRSFEMFLQKEVERGIRYNRRLSTIMIDIDHFKEYNDSFGHPAGDDALRKVAEDIQNGARRGLDVISRYGGEEFAVILPETEVEGARIVAENIRMSVESDTRFRRKMTISLGIASLSGEQLSHANLIEQADRALYQAKEQGRNRAILYEEWMQESAHVDKPEK